MLDESGRMFRGRIISRDDYTDVALQHKKLDKVRALDGDEEEVEVGQVFPIDEHRALVIILDDNAETWDHQYSDGRNSQENLIQVDKYPRAGLVLSLS